MKLVNKTGYLKGTKTAKNPVNIIPSNLITTQGMAFPIKANGKTLYPNTGQYKFPTSHVVETPLYERGGIVRLLKSAKPYLKSAYNKAKKLFSTAEETPKTVLKKAEPQIETPEVTPPPARRKPALRTKGTMKGGTISKQVSPQGTIQRKAIESYASGKEVSEAERRVLKKALEQHDVSENNINFENFLKNVEGHISSLNQEKAAKLSDYGLERINRFRPSHVLIQDKIHGFDESINATKFEIEQLSKSNNVADFHRANDLRNRNLPYLENSKKDLQEKLKNSEKHIVDLNEGEGEKVSKNYTMLFSNPKKFGEGTGNPDSGLKHFDLPHQAKSVLGHSRFFADDDDVLHVLESQSDYFQGKKFKNYKEKRKKLEDDLEKLNASEDINPSELPEMAKARNTLINDTKKALEDYNYEKEALGKYHIERLLQENMAHAHGEGYKKLRYPTSGTAHKIQGWPTYTEADRLKVVEEELSYLSDSDAFKRLKDDDIVNYEDFGTRRYSENPLTKKEFFEKVNEEANRLRQLPEHELNAPRLKKEYQTVSKKYDEFPSMYKKMFGVEPRKVTDKQGHSWYEMDVPEDFEIRAFKKGSKNISIQKYGPGDRFVKLAKTAKPIYSKLKPYLSEAYDDGRKTLQKIFPSFDEVVPTKKVVEEVPVSTEAARTSTINLQREGPKPQKPRIFKFNIDVPHPSLRIRKKFRGNKDIPKELIVEGKSGYIRANRRPDDGSYYFNANMQNPLESGKAMLELDKLLEPKPSIYDNNSLSLDSYKTLLNLRNRKHWSGEHIGFIPLNESAVHNKTLHKLGIKPDANKVSFDTEDKANTALDEINNMLQKQGIEHKAELFKHADGGFGINMPNFKVSRDYKKGSKNMSSLIKYKDGSKGVSLSFGRKEKDPKGGLTQKGVDKYNRATGGNLKMAVTTPPSKLKPGSKAANRRKNVK